MLSERFKVIAKEELREDENRKQQALHQFKDWIDKHPFIRNVRQDDIYLLMFLRTKKYQMDEVFRLFENFHAMLKRYETSFRVPDEDNSRMMQLYWSGYVFPLAERDQYGRSILVTQVFRIDPDNYAYSNAIRLTLHIASALHEEEETQISGFVFVFDYSNLTLKQMSCLSIKDMIEMADAASNSPGRNKQMILVNLPSFAVFLIEMFKKSMKEKLRERIVLVKSMEEVGNFIKPSILPKEYGGELSEQEHLNRFMVKYNERQSKLDGIYLKPKVNLEAQNKIGNETVGSFRKLDID